MLIVTLLVREFWSKNLYTRHNINKVWVNLQEITTIFNERFYNNEFFSSCIINFFIYHFHSDL